jgi:hypothetical protein
MHGKDAVIEEILDWRPFDYVTLTNQLPIPGTPKITTTLAFIERPNGTTRIEFRVGKPKPKDRTFVDQAGEDYQKQVAENIARLRLMLEGREASVAVIDEPPMLPTQERFLTEPVHSHKH